MSERGRLTGGSPGPFRYRADVLERLWAHGVQPTGRTPPDLVRDYVRDLYKYEIRRLRERYLRREFPKPSIRSGSTPCAGNTRCSRCAPGLARAVAQARSYVDGRTRRRMPWTLRRFEAPEFVDSGVIDMLVIEIREPGGPEVLVPAERATAVGRAGEDPDQGGGSRRQSP